MHHHIPNTNLSQTDRMAIIAMVKADPTLWPSKLSDMWGIAPTQAAVYISKANESYKAKSVI